MGIISFPAVSTVVQVVTSLLIARRNEGLANRVDIRLLDYRDVNEHFDKITSAGMVEHVDLKNLRLYFATMRRLLKDDGLALNHGITSTNPDTGATPYVAGAFIEKYVFPHGELPHMGWS